MRLEDLLRLMLDPLAGGRWPQRDEPEFRPTWYEGLVWAVEYQFCRPAMSLDSLPFGDRVTGTFRYEVLRKEEVDDTSYWVVEVRPLDGVEAGVRYLCRYRADDLSLQEARRLVAGEERPLKLGSLPGFPRSRELNETDNTLTRVVTIEAAQLVEEG